MSEKLAQARLLVEQKKYKKALAILKKINQKSGQSTYGSIELEAICLFEQKQYPLARIKFEQCLKLADKPQHTVGTYDNLSVIALREGHSGQALEYLRQAVELDSSGKKVSRRMELVTLAVQTGEHQIIQEYAPGLLAPRLLYSGSRHTHHKLCAV